ncbi:MAG: hypothetical protein ACKO3V_07155 [Pirellula sp.]
MFNRVLTAQSIRHGQDASGAIQTQRLLDESTERFRAVADYTYDWESWIQSDGKLIWVNPAVERLTGFSVTDCFQMPEYPIELVDAPDTEAASWECIASGKGREYDASGSPQSDDSSGGQRRSIPDMILYHHIAKG